MNRSRSYLAAAALFLLSAGAVGAPEQGIESQEGQSETIDGEAWRLVGYQAGDKLVEVVESPKPAQFRFRDGQLAGGTGCNQISGSYRIEGTRLSIGKNMASTMMGCPARLMEQESAIIAALAKVVDYRRDGTRLDLRDAGGATLLRFQTLGGSGLTGRVWRLVAYDRDALGPTLVLEGTQISLVFNPQGTLGGSDGCNRYMSGYRLEDDRLTIGPIATTRMACEETDGRAKQAAAYAAALRAVRGYRISGHRLELLGSDGRILARFRTTDSRSTE